MKRGKSKADKAVIEDEKAATVREGARQSIMGRDQQEATAEQRKRDSRGSWLARLKRFFK